MLPIHSQTVKARRFIFASPILAVALLGPALALGDENPDDPCGGNNSLLAILDRPTVGDSACVVPFKQAVVELGFQMGKYRDGSSGYNLPEAETRIGLRGNSELVLLTPNYFRLHLNGKTFSGPSASVIGIKHELGYSGNWLGAVESLITLPSGNASYGSQGAGIAVNGIVNYSPTGNTSVSLMMGTASQTLSRTSGGQRYTSLNPDFVATWTPINKVQVYGELYGQSRTSPGAGWGWNGDAGLQYLLTPNIEVDAEVGMRVAGYLGGIQRYGGAGLGIKF